MYQVHYVACMIHNFCFVYFFIFYMFACLFRVFFYVRNTSGHSGAQSDLFLLFEIFVSQESSNFYFLPMSNFRAETCFVWKDINENMPGYGNHN